ncbi:reverse transcriptase domain-containing protein [Tanacetum coccineum]
MTLELANRSVAYPVGVAEYVFMKVGKLHFLANFVVVDYDVDPRVPLILERPLLRTAQALINVHVKELTLQVNDEAITFNYAQEVLEFSDSSKSGNPTLSLDPISTTSSPTLTPFEVGRLFLLEKVIYMMIHPLISPKELFLRELKVIKSSIDDPPKLELKDLPSHLEYAFLEGTNKLPVIISKNLKDEDKARLLKILKSHKRAIAWKIFDIKGIDPYFCTHKILMEDDFKLAVQHQRRVNPKIHEVIKKEVIKLLDAELIYPISDSLWVSPVHCVPKNGGMTIVMNEDNELIPTRLVTGWRICIDYRKLNDATRKYHFSLPFMDQMLKRLAGNEYYCFLDGFSRYFQISIDPQDQDKTTFTCPYGMFAYRRMPFDLCNAPGTFQRCMMDIFHDMIEETMEVFMDDFSVFGDSFSSCLSHLEKMLKRCKDTNLVLNWEKCHFMVKKGIVLGHKISKSRIEVDKAKVDVIAKLPHPIRFKVFYWPTIYRDVPLSMTMVEVMLSHVTSRQNLAKRTKCPKMQFKFARSLTYGASTLWAHFRLLEGTNPFVEIPSGEIKVHIEVLSVLWGNRLPLLDGSLSLSRVNVRVNFPTCPSLLEGLHGTPLTSHQAMLAILRFPIGLEDVEDDLRALNGRLSVCYGSRAWIRSLRTLLMA